MEVGLSVGDFFQADWPTWLEFFKNKWVIIVLALIVVVFLISVMKTVMKWVIVVVLALGLVIYSGYSLEDLKEIKDSITNKVEDEVIGVMAQEVTSATYQDNGDGSFTVESDNIKLTGVLREGEVTLALRGQEVGKIKLTEAIEKFIEAAKLNYKQ
jgi:Ca2+/Na+ antiporter